MNAARLIISLAGPLLDSFLLCFRRRTKRSQVEESGGLFPRRQPALVRLRDGVAEEDQPIVGKGTEVRKANRQTASSGMEWNGIGSQSIFRLYRSIYPFPLVSGPPPSLRHCSCRRLIAFGKAVLSFVPNSRDDKSGGDQQQVLNETLSFLSLFLLLSYFHSALRIS